MTNLGYQLNWIWNQLKQKILEMSMSDFLGDIV